ncbi:MAG: PKD domain-containing protein [Bacteroidales bacterium]|nr:PKD domain-containing protein [Bacteroidales bacterium]
MKRYKFITFMLFVFCVNLYSQNVNPVYSHDESVEEMLARKGEVYFSFQISSRKELIEFTDIVSVDHFNDDTVFAYANRKEFEAFLKTATPYFSLPHPGELIHPAMKEVVNLRALTEWDFYPTYEAYVDMMYEFESVYPDICVVENIGTLPSGRELLVAKITDNVNEREDEPQFLYTSTMHGDETTGYILMLRLMDYLLSNYNSDPRVTNLVNSIEIWINPLANPDGTYAAGNHTVNGATRYNANNVDLNRNYPDPEDGPHPDGNPWQPETIYFMDFAENMDFVMSANFHGGAELINYPWDTWVQRAADDNWWIYVSYEYADTVHANSSGYFYDLGDGVTNGYDWYTINGGRQDYMNYFQYCRESTIELSSVKLLPASQLPAHWEYNYRSFLNYMEQSLYGVRGVVTDSLSGEPIKAKIFIDAHDIDSSHVYSSLPVGNYHRLLFEGTYDITYTAEGYYPKEVQQVNVVNGMSTIQHIQLAPGDLIAGFAASQTVIPVGGEVEFTDQSYGNITTWEWQFEGGSPEYSSEQNPVVSYAELGTYDVTLTVSDGTQSNTLVKSDYIMVNLEFIMANDIVETSEGVFYDSGGDQGNYSNNENITMTFFPAQRGGRLRFDFTMFDVEYNSSCSYDWLKIYDGPDSSSPLLGTFCGTDSPGTVLSSDDSGALTFTFHSNGNVNEPGWQALISYEPNVGYTYIIDPVAWIFYPNPTDDMLYVSLQSDENTSRKVQLRLIDMYGKTIKQIEKLVIPRTKAFELDIHDFQAGIYFLVINDQKMIITGKIVIQE